MSAACGGRSRSAEGASESGGSGGELHMGAGGNGVSRDSGGHDCEVGTHWCECAGVGAACLQYCACDAGDCPHQGSPGACPDSGGSAGSGGATTGRSGSFCPDYELDPTRNPSLRCEHDEECAALLAGPSVCAIAEPRFECGGPAPRHECDVDGDCTAGSVCQIGACQDQACVLGCTSAPCAANEECVGARCVRKSCFLPDSACQPGFTCIDIDPGYACLATACSDGYACPVTTDCRPLAASTDEHGCVQRACASSADCDCGFCVDALCQPTPGYCFPFVAPP